MPKYRVKMHYGDYYDLSYELNVSACSLAGAEWIAKATIADCGWWPGITIENVIKGLIIDRIEEVTYHE